MLSCAAVTNVITFIAKVYFIVHRGPWVTLRGNWWSRLDLHISRRNIRSSDSSWHSHPDICHFLVFTFHCLKHLYGSSKLQGVEENQDFCMPRSRDTCLLLHKLNVTLKGEIQESTFLIPLVTHIHTQVWGPLGRPGVLNLSCSLQLPGEFKKTLMPWPYSQRS